MDKTTFCYIDDSQANLLLIKKALSNDYNVVTIDVPTQAIEQLLEAKPSLILLDVNMPEIDGYEICKAIRKEEALSDIPVVFLTCRSSLEDRLQGFESGGDAYVTKPFDLDELRYIIQVQLNRYHCLLQAADKADSANEMAWVMMKNSGEIGQVVQYARALSNTREESTLLTKTFETLEEFGLNSTILLRLTAGEIVARSDKKAFTPIEEQLLQLAKQGRRIISVGNKYLFCGESCLFLIKNMPVEDEGLAGRLRDHLAIMLESCDACIELINYRTKESEQKKLAASQTEMAVMTEFEKVITLFESLNNKAHSTFEQLAGNIESSFMFLGLTEEQESQLSQYIEQAKADIDHYMDAGASLQDAMNRVAESIRLLSAGPQS